MPPTVTALDPAVFPAEVQAFAAERGVTDYLVPLYELAERCFPGATITVAAEADGDEPGLGWVCYEVGAAGWDARRYREAKDRWHAEYLRMPPAVRQAFVLGVR